jgi:CO/xanthine dehydrogenase Mo-binding subunit
VCNIRIDFDGAVMVTLGTGPSGQGHETATSQVVADELNIDPSMVTVAPASYGVEYVFQGFAPMPASSP